jgi:hypothetical protein
MSLFASIKGAFVKKPVDDGFRLYVRDHKPAALRGWIFNERVASSLNDGLVESGLLWLFESTRTGPTIETAEPPAPEHRVRQPLTPASAAELSADLVERNIHGFRRFVALYGGSEELLCLTEDEALHEAVEAFCLGEDSSVKVLVIQFGDVAPDFIYFQPNKEPNLAAFFNALEIPSIAEVQKTDYQELNGEDLETAVKYLSCAEHDH